MWPPEMILAVQHDPLSVNGKFYSLIDSLDYVFIKSVYSSFATYVPRCFVKI